MTNGPVTNGPVFPAGAVDPAVVAPRVVADRHPADVLAATGFATPPPPRPPIPTAALRVAIVVALLALIGLVAAASVDALRSSHWRRPRPVLTQEMGLAAAVLLAAGCLWAAIASLNARRAGLRTAPSPVLAPLAAVLIAGSGVAVDRIVATHRDAVWSAWMAASLLAYGFVALNYRALARSMDDVDQHFGLVAWLPVFTGGLAIGAAHSEWFVFALPMVAAMSLWLPIELYLATAGWDRECRFRITGRDPHNKPIREQFDEAVQQASAMRRIAEPERENYHHTMVPRAMVTAALGLGLTLPAWVILLEHNGRLEVSGVHTTVDAYAGRMLTGLVAATMITYGIGWIWWAVAAALNAQSHSRWSVSPWSAPIGYAVSAGVTIAAPVVLDRVEPDAGLVVVLFAGLMLAMAHFWVLRAYRRAADAMAGPTGPWTRVIAIPWVVVGFSLLAAVLGRILEDDLFSHVMQVSWVLFYAAYAASLYQAMASFDRACRGRMALHADREALPEFLKQRRGGADRRS